eukprot:scaffold13353_cov105-Isochrysis_galbana.AAC.2
MAKAHKVRVTIHSRERSGATHPKRLINRTDHLAILVPDRGGPRVRLRIRPRHRPVADGRTFSPRMRSVRHHSCHTPLLPFFPRHCSPVFAVASLHAAVH